MGHFTQFGKHCVKTLFLTTLCFSSWYRMKLKPWFSSRIAKPATSHTQISLHTWQSKPAQAGRTASPRSSPVTAQASKILLVKMPWHPLPMQSSVPMCFHSRDRSLPTRQTSGQPQGSAVGMGLCLLGKWAWTVLGLPEKTRVVIKRERSKGGSEMCRRTERQLWKETSRIVPTRET